MSLSFWQLNFLLFLVGIGPWLPTTSLFSQIPILATRLPEKYGIGSYFVAAVQLGNLPSFLVALMLNRKQCRIRHTAVMIPLFILQVAVPVWLAVLWDWTVPVGGSPVSVGALGGMVLAGVCGCVSVVVLYPFVASLTALDGPFHYLIKRDPAVGARRALTALSAGMGANGLIASLLTLVQQPGQPHCLFGPRTYFVIVALVNCVSLAALVAVLAAAAHGSARRRRPPSAHAENEPDPTDPLLSINGKFPSVEVLQEPSLVTPTTVAPPSMLELCSHETLNCALGFFILGANPLAFRSFAPQLSKDLLFAGTIGWNVCYFLGRSLTGCLMPRGRRVRLGLVLLSATCLLLAAVGSVRVFDVTILGRSAGLGSALVCLYSLFALVNGYQEILLFQLAETERRTRYVGVAQQFGACIGSISALIINLYI